MSLTTISPTTASNIATAIKNKLEITGTIKGNEFSSYIEAIPSARQDMYMIMDGEVLDSRFNSEYSTILTQSNNCTQGSKSILMAPTSPLGNLGNVGCMITYVMPEVIDLSKYNTIMVDFYSSQALPVGQFQMNFCSEGRSDGKNFLVALDNKLGWQRYVINMSTGFTTINDAQWNNIKQIRFTYFNVGQLSDCPNFLIDNVIAFKV